MVLLGSELVDTELSAFLRDNEERKQTMQEILNSHHISKWDFILFFAIFFISAMICMCSMVIMLEGNSEMGVHVWSYIAF